MMVTLTVILAVTVAVTVTVTKATLCPLYQICVACVCVSNVGFLPPSACHADSIEANVETAQINVEHGRDQLTKARDYQVTFSHS